ncbi:MAG: Uncharacterised protein [Cryomorphaceae bacterium]|nr:MAG: Uncharacterised protein [Cryomorphaceae bacterium]
MIKLVMIWVPLVNFPNSQMSCKDRLVALGMQRMLDHPKMRTSSEDVAEDASKIQRAVLTWDNWFWKHQMPSRKELDSTKRMIAMPLKFSRLCSKMAATNEGMVVNASNDIGSKVALSMEESMLVPAVISTKSRLVIKAAIQAEPVRSEE